MELQMSTSPVASTAGDIHVIDDMPIKMLPMPRLNFLPSVSISEKIQFGQSTAKLLMMTYNLTPEGYNKISELIDTLSTDEYFRRGVDSVLINYSMRAT